MESNAIKSMDMGNVNPDVRPAPGVAADEYENKAIGAELTKADINTMAWRSLLLQASFNFERMQASGWLYGLLPALKKSIPTKRIFPRRCKGIWASSTPTHSWSPL